MQRWTNQLAKTKNGSIIILGDRILNVTISFRNVVFEDAMTILSYASPYDVTLELEKGLRNNGSTLKKRKASSTVSLASSSANVTLLAGTGSAQPEGPPNERLVHPLYRSQSIDDLSKVRINIHILTCVSCAACWWLVDISIAVAAVMLTDLHGLLSSLGNVPSERRKPHQHVRARLRRRERDDRAAWVFELHRP